MQLLRQTETGRLRIVLLAAVVGVVAYSALQVSTLLSARGQLRSREEHLARARLMAAIARPLDDATRLLRDETGCAGDSLPESVVAALKEKFTLGPELGDELGDELAEELGENEKEKTPLSSATASQLVTELAVHRSLADFIVANRTASSIDALGKRKRNVFDQHRAGIAPLIVRRVSEIAAASQIKKLDQFKVDPPKVTRRTARRPASAPKRTTPDAASAAAVRSQIRRATAAAPQIDGDAFREALDEVVRIAERDPTVQELAASQLTRMLEQVSLSTTAAAQIKIAALASRPTAMRVSASLLRAHVEAALATFPEKLEDADPVDYVQPPFPQLVVLPPHVQKRLLEVLAGNGGLWMTEEALSKVLRTLIVPPATEDDDADEESEDSAGPVEGPKQTDDVGTDDLAPEPNDTVDADDRTTDEGALTEPEEEDTAPEPIDEALRQDALAYHAALIDTLWRASQVAQSIAAKTGSVYEATIEFQAPLDQLVTFIHKLESDVPWIHVDGLRIAIGNADGPTLSVTLSMKATVL